MDYNEKLGILERGLQRRIDELPKFVKQMDDEIQKVNEIVDEFNNLIEDYKYDEQIRKQLKTDERLIKLAGNKTKLSKILKDPERFIAMIENGKQRFRENYGSIEGRYRLAIEEATESLPQVEKLLELIKTNEINHETLKLFVDIFLTQALTDWKEYEESVKQNEQPSE